MEHAAVTPATSQAEETAVYRRAEVEGFAAWARTTISRLEFELAEHRWRADAAEERATIAAAALADRRELQAVVAQALALFHHAAVAPDEERAVDKSDPPPSEVGLETSDVLDDPVLDPLPPWGERLLAFPDEPTDLPPIGPIFGSDAHRSA